MQSVSLGLKSMAVIQRQRRLFSSQSASSSSSSSLPCIAVVTGAGSGIGRAVCNILSQRGVNIVAADKNGESAGETISKLSATGVTHISQTVDVSQRDSVANLFHKVIQEYQIPANMIINCAGITRDALLMKMTDEQFDEVLNVNIRGTLYPTQIGCKQIIDFGKRDWGSVVNVSSTSGKYGNVGQVNYATSKAGIYGFTKSVAKEMAKYNIRCNAVVPGFIDTPMVKSIPEHLAQISLMLIALKRKGRPEEVAEAIAFLASEKSSYITGTTIDVTGGFLM